MNLAIPYTFYPSALPASLAWILFLATLFGAIGIGVLFGRTQSPIVGFLAAIPAFALFLFASVIVSMILTFFMHGI